jgi:ATP-dependent Zn protease
MESRAEDILTQHRRQLNVLAAALQEYETLDAQDVERLLEMDDVKDLTEAALQGAR